MIDHHGAEEVTSLMQKVISALEHLEILVQNNETEQLMIEDLKKTIEHLEHEETKKADERLKYARDIEQVEEHFKVKLNTQKIFTHNSKHGTKILLKENSLILSSINLF